MALEQWKKFLYIIFLLNKEIEKKLLLNLVEKIFHKKKR